jgi:hypothetical protein
MDRPSLGLPPPLLLDPLRPELLLDLLVLLPVRGDGGDVSGKHPAIASRKPPATCLSTNQPEAISNFPVNKPANSHQQLARRQTSQKPPATCLSTNQLTATSNLPVNKPAKSYKQVAYQQTSQQPALQRPTSS